MDPPPPQMAQSQGPPLDQSRTSGGGTGRRSIARKEHAQPHVLSETGSIAIDGRRRTAVPPAQLDSTRLSMSRRTSADQPPSAPAFPMVTDAPPPVPHLTTPTEPSGGAAYAALSTPRDAFGTSHMSGPAMSASEGASPRAGSVATLPARSTLRSATSGQRTQPSPPSPGSSQVRQGPPASMQAQPGQSSALPQPMAGGSDPQRPAVASQPASLAPLDSAAGAVPVAATASESRLAPAVDTHAGTNRRTSLVSSSQMALIMAKTAEYQSRLQTELEASRRRLVAYEGLVGPLEGLGAGGAGGAAPPPPQQVQPGPAIPSSSSSGLLGRSSAGESSRGGHGSIALAALQVTMATAAVAAATAAADLPSPQRGGYAAPALTARRANLDAPLPLQLMRAVERGSRASSSSAPDHASDARHTPSLTAAAASSARFAAAPPLRPSEQAVAPPSSADAPFPQEAVDDVWAWLGPSRPTHDDAAEVAVAEGSASHDGSSSTGPEPTRYGAADAPLHLAQRWGPASPFPSDPSRAAGAGAAAAEPDDGVVVPSSDDEAVSAPPPARAVSPPASQLARYRAPAPTPLLSALRARSAAQQQFRQASPQGATGLLASREPQRDDTAGSDAPPEQVAPSESSLRDSLPAAPQLVQSPPPPQPPLRAPPAGSWLSLQAQQLQLPRQRWPVTAVDAPGAQADFILAPGPAAVSQRSALAVSGGGGTGEQLSSTTSARYRDSAPVVQPLGASQNAGFLGRQVSAATLATAAAFLAAANNDGDTGGRAVVQQHPHARPLLPPDAWQAGGGNWRTALQQQTQTQADPRPSRRAMSADALGGSRSRRGGGGSGSASIDESDVDEAWQASPSGRGGLLPSAGGQSGFASRAAAAFEASGAQAAPRQVDVRPIRPRQVLDEAPPPMAGAAAADTIATPHAPPDAAYASAPVVTLTRVPRPTAHPSDPEGAGGTRLGGTVDIPLTTSELHARLLPPPHPRSAADASLPVVPGGRSDDGDAHVSGPTADPPPGTSRPVRMRKGGGGAAYELSAGLVSAAALTDAPQSLAALPFAPQHSFSDSISTRLEGRASAPLCAASTDARTKAAAAAALAAAEAAAEEASDADDASVAGRRRYEDELAAGACELADNGTAVAAQQQPWRLQHEESSLPRHGSSVAETATPVESMPAPGLVSSSASGVPEMARRTSARLEREMEREAEVREEAVVDDDELDALRSRNAALEADVVVARAALEEAEQLRHVAEDRIAELETAALTRSVECAQAISRAEAAERAFDDFQSRAAVASAELEAQVAAAEASARSLVEDKARLDASLAAEREAHEAALQADAAASASVLEAARVAGLALLEQEKAAAGELLAAAEKRTVAAEAKAASTGAVNDDLRKQLAARDAEIASLRVHLRDASDAVVDASLKVEALDAERRQKQLLQHQSERRLADEGGPLRTSQAPTDEAATTAGAIAAAENLRAQLVAAEESAAAWRVQATAAEEALQLAQGRCAAADAAATQLAIDRDVAEAAYTRATADVSALRSDVADLQRALEDSLRERAVVRTNNDGVTAERRRVEGRLSAALSDLAAVTAERSRVQARLNSTLAQLAAATSTAVTAAGEGGGSPAIAAAAATLQRQQIRETALVHLQTQRDLEAALSRLARAEQRAAESEANAESARDVAAALRDRVSNLGSDLDEARAVLEELTVVTAPLVEGAQGRAGGAGPSASLAPDFAPRPPLSQEEGSHPPPRGITLAAVASTAVARSGELEASPRDDGLSDGKVDDERTVHEYGGRRELGSSSGISVPPPAAVSAPKSRPLGVSSAPRAPSPVPATHWQPEQFPSTASAGPDLRSRSAVRRGTGLRRTPSTPNERATSEDRHDAPPSPSRARAAPPPPPDPIADDLEASYEAVAHLATIAFGVHAPAPAVPIPTPDSAQPVQRWERGNATASAAAGVDVASVRLQPVIAPPAPAPSLAGRSTRPRPVIQPLQTAGSRNTTATTLLPRASIGNAAPPMRFSASQTPLPSQTQVIDLFSPTMPQTQSSGGPGGHRRSIGGSSSSSSSSYGPRAAATAAAASSSASSRAAPPRNGSRAAQPAPHARAAPQRVPVVVSSPSRRPPGVLPRRPGLSPPSSAARPAATRLPAAPVAASRITRGAGKGSNDSNIFSSSAIAAMPAEELIAGLAAALGGANDTALLEGLPISELRLLAESLGDDFRVPASSASAGASGKRM